jgi:dipeptidyl aminopeptidase/acylaminoacyl peptidase
LASDEHTLIHSSDHTNFAGPFSRDGKYVIISRHYKSLSNDLFLVNVETGELTLLTPHEGDVSFHAPCFSSDGRYLYLLSNKDSEFTRVARIELNNQEWLWITDDQWDAETLRLSPDGRYIAYSLNVDGTSQLVVRDLAEGTSPAGEPVGQLPKLPSGVIEDVNWSTSGYTIAITLSSPRYAVDIWTIDVETNALCRATYASISGVPSEQFVEPELVHYTSFDGLSIPAFYYKPKHSEGPYRVVVYVHGGPESQFRNSFNPILQHLIAEGFAVFAPNVRGSSGYGRTYVHLDDIRKRMDSVADLAKAVEWLSLKTPVPIAAICESQNTARLNTTVISLTKFPQFTM